MKMPQLVCGLLLSCSGLTVLACEHPSLPIIPAKEDIEDPTRQVRRDMQRYIPGMVDYVACIQAELAAVEGDAAPSMQLAPTLLVLRNNNAVAEVGTMTDLFVDRVGPIEDLIPQGSLSAGAQDLEVIDAEPEVCLSMNRVSKTKVIDDRTILFYARGGDIYLNALEQNCPGLRRNGRFSQPPG